MNHIDGYDLTVTHVEAARRKICGTTGVAWLVGLGVPGNGSGSDGDFYLDGTTGSVYLKAAGSWSLAFSLGGGGSDCYALVDGGEPDTFYGLVTPLDGGAVIQ